MDARTIDDAGERLRELRHEEWQELGLGALALGLAVAATRMLPSLALPLFLGGVGVGLLGLRALWRRWDLLARAVRESTMERRHRFAASIRGALLAPAPGCAPRVGAAARELEALAAELDDPALALDPASGVACSRLLTDVESSPLLNPVLPPEDLRSRVLQIRSGLFVPER